MRERRKEPREGSEIDPETACIQTVGALLNWSLPRSSLLSERASQDAGETQQKIFEGSEERELLVD